MSIPKEKLIISKIREMLEYRRKNIETTRISPLEYLRDIEKLVNDYVDPGYIGGPVVGEEIKEE